MKKILYVLLGLFIITSCEQNRIVYVNNSYVINEYQERKDIEAKYKAKVEAYTKKRDSIGQALQLEYQTFQLKSKNMSEKDAQAEYNVLMQKQQMLQQQFQLEEQQIAKESQTEIDSLITKVKSFIKQHGKENNYTYILGTSDAAASVLYGQEKNDISEIILKALNNNYSE